MPGEFFFKQPKYFMNFRLEIAKTVKNDKLLSMVRWVIPSYLQEMVNQAYLGQEINCYFCSKSNCNFCQKTSHYEEDLREKM